MEPVILSQLEQEYLLRVIESSVQVRDARQFFLWTHGQLQALPPHRLMLCMQFDAAGALLRLEPITPACSTTRPCAACAILPTAWPRGWRACAATASGCRP